MSETLPPPLPPELVALLDAEREREGLSDAAEGRVLERLERSLHWPQPRRWPTTLGVFAGGLLLGAALCAVLMAWLSGPVQPKLLVLDPPPPPPPAVVVLRTQTPPVAVAPSEQGPASRPIAEKIERSPGQPAAPAAPSAEDEHDTELARERALIETARTALARKQPDGIELLLRHERQSPLGRLAEERESLLVQALMQAGRAEEARARGERFRARWPSSLLLPVVDAVLQAIP